MSAYVPTPEQEAALIAAGWRKPERVMWATGCANFAGPHHHVGGHCEKRQSAPYPSPEA